ncbi:MAG: aminotransferase class IV [Bacteroidales bacterium]
MKPLFIETIRIAKGKAQLTDYHQKRLDRTQETFYKTKSIKLLDIIPNTNSTEDMKCRILYSDKLEDVELVKYSKHNIKELVIVNANDISYEYKSADRQAFDKMTRSLENHQLPIIVKNGFITDTPISNIIVRIDNKLITPANPLLKGVQRQYLIDTCSVVETPVPTSILQHAEEIILINCMMPIDNAIRLPATAIKCTKKDLLL